MPYSKTPKVPEDAEARVIAMRAEAKRKSRKEMAKELGIRMWQLDKIVGSLIARGQAKASQGAQKVRGGRSGNLADPRTALIIAMTRDHRTLEEMRERVSRECGKITRERVRQIQLTIAEIHGEAILAPDKSVWCAHAAMKALRAEGFSASDAIVISICETGTIDCLDRPRQDAKFLITELGMAQLRRHPRVTLKRKCSVCRKKFVGRANICGEACKKKHEQRKYRERGKNPPDPGKMRAVHRKVLRALPIMGGRTEWVVWSEALRVANITGTQIDYLRGMKIIATRKDPKRKWRKKPRVLYSREEMKIIRPIFAAWRRKQDQERKKKGD